MNQLFPTDLRDLLKRINLLKHLQPKRDLRLLCQLELHEYDHQCCQDPAQQMKLLYFLVLFLLENELIPISLS